MRVFGVLVVACGLATTIGCGAKPGANSSPTVLVPATEPPAPPREQVVNPQYQSWSAHPIGATITHRSITETAGTASVTTTTTTYKLLERTEDLVVIEMQANTKRHDGAEIATPTEKFRHPKLITLAPGVSKEDFGKPAKSAQHGEETLTIGGKAYKTRWHTGKDRSEGGEVTVKVWSCEDVPGGLVKSITETPGVGKKTTIELVEVRSNSH